MSSDTSDSGLYRSCKTYEDLVDAFLKAAEELPEAERINASIFDLLGLHAAPKSMLTSLQTAEALNSKKRRSATENKLLGESLEQVAVYMSWCLRSDKPESFQSAGPQFDLVSRSDTVLWKKHLGPALVGGPLEGILWECKATKSPVDDQQVARLAGILDHSLPSVGLCLVLSLKGASGTASLKAGRRVLSDARLRQILYHMRPHGKPIVVFDLDELKRVAAGENLARMIRRKILELEEMRATPSKETALAIDAPPHITSAIDLLTWS